MAAMPNLVTWPKEIKITGQRIEWMGSPSDEYQNRLNDPASSLGPRWSSAVDHLFGTVEISRRSAYPRHRDINGIIEGFLSNMSCLLYTSPSPRD